MKINENRKSLNIAALIFIDFQYQSIDYNWLILIDIDYIDYWFSLIEVVWVKGQILPLKSASCSGCPCSILFARPHPHQWANYSFVIDIPCLNIPNRWIKENELPRTKQIHEHNSEISVSGYTSWDMPALAHTFSRQKVAARPPRPPPDWCGLRGFSSLKNFYKIFLLWMGFILF